MRACLVAIGLALPCAADEDDRPKIASVVVWLRVTSDAELRLGPECQALRELVERGTTLPRLSRLRSDALARELEAVEAEVGRGYAAQATASPDEGVGAADLASSLGAPPPVTDAEREALARLQASRPGGKGSPDGSSGEAPSTRPAADDGPDVSEVVFTALVERSARLIVVRTDSANGLATDRDSDIALLSSTVAAAPDATGKLTERVLLTVLLPEGAPPLVVVTGAGIKAGRVVREDLDATDVAAGVRRLLGLAIEKGDTGWVDACLLDLSRSPRGQEPARPSAARPSPGIPTGSSGSGGAR